MVFSETELVRIAGDLVLDHVPICRDEEVAEDFSFYVPDEGVLEVLQLDVGFAPSSGNPEMQNTICDFDNWLGGIAFASSVEIKDDEIDIVKKEVIRFLEVGKKNG